MEWFGKINRSLHDDRTGQQISYNQIWRSLDDCENKMESGVDKSAYTEFDCVHLPYVDSYPKPPYHLENSSSGYWILEAGQLPLNWELDNNLTLNGGYTGTDQWPF